MNTLVKAFVNQGLKAQRLTLDYVIVLQTLFNQCKDFFIENEGEVGEAKRVLMSLPQGKSIEDKICFGFWEGKTMIAFLDLIFNYPCTDTVTIGYLLIHPEMRSRNLGHTIIKALERGLTEISYLTLRIIVQQQNLRALQFWRREGFEGIEQQTQILSFKQNQVIICKKNLDQGESLNAESDS